MAAITILYLFDVLMYMLSKICLYKKKQPALNCYHTSTERGDNVFLENMSNNNYSSLGLSVVFVYSDKNYSESEICLDQVFSFFSIV